MIYLYQNKTNVISTRFFDRRKMADSFFLWEISNATSETPIYFITDDTSILSCAFNLFELTLDDSGSKIGGIDIPLYLEPGHNTYTVYETSQYSLDPQFSLGVIEKDIMFVEIIRGVNTADSQQEDIYY